MLAEMKHKQLSDTISWINGRCICTVSHSGSKSPQTQNISLFVVCHVSFDAFIFEADAPVIVSSTVAQKSI